MPYLVDHLDEPPSCAPIAAELWRQPGTNRECNVNKPRLAITLS
jgi:hypothetical protein